jgi:hypothetical protein
MPKKMAAVAEHPETYEEMIAEAAYYKAQKRGFVGGQELADWFAAESEVERLLLQGSEPTAKSGKAGGKSKSNGGKRGATAKKKKAAS